ncbi:MAG: putative ABC transporter permease subunit [Smithellaceae bacterium]
MKNTILTLLSPRLLSARNGLRPGEQNNRWMRILLFAFIGLIFWMGAFLIFYRVLTYFQSVEDFGDILAIKLLSMMIITFFTLLLFSSIINILSHLYLSRDLPLLHSLPVSISDIFFSRWLISAFDSSWMVVAFSIPVFLSYGLVYHAGIVFYLIALASIICMCLMASAISSIFVLLGAATLPAGKIRTLFVILGVFLAVLLVIVLRMIRPEQLVNPDSFASVVLYLNSMQALSLPYLPTTWITDTVRFSLKSEWNLSLLNLALSASCVVFLMFINEITASTIYFRGFSRAQTTAKRLFAPVKFRGYSWEGLLNFLSRPAKAFAVKEIRSFFRDSTQWPQLFLICALIVVYLYNFSVLPLDRSPIKTIYLQNVFSFLNMGLAAFVLSAIAARFVFPAVSMEGEAFWIIQSAPVSIKTFLWIKFFLYYVPLLILTETLIIASNILLGVTPFMMFLSILTIFCLVPAVVALAVGLGARYPDFKSENPAMTATSFGGLLFMLLSLGLIALVIILEAGPVYRIFMVKMHGLSFSILQIIRFVLSFAFALFLCILAVFYPMKLGERNLLKR